jgi:hypothetical protein
METELHATELKLENSGNSAHTHSSSVEFNSFGYFPLPGMGNKNKIKLVI